jgi:hypothetical protein
LVLQSPLKSDEPNAESATVITTSMHETATHRTTIAKAFWRKERERGCSKEGQSRLPVPRQNKAKHRNIVDHPANGGKNAFVQWVRANTIPANTTVAASRWMLHLFRRITRRPAKIGRKNIAVNPTAVGISGHSNQPPPSECQTK